MSWIPCCILHKKLSHGQKNFFIKGDISEDLLAFIKDFMEVGVDWALEEEMCPVSGWVNG